MDSFLDSGVVIGFCFYLDRHGSKCRRYVSDSIINGSVDGYKSNLVDKEFNRRYGSKVPEIREEALKHRSYLLGSSLNGSLDSLDFATITDKHIDSAWEISTALKRWYDKEVNSGIEYTDLVQRVAKVARTVEVRVTKNQKKLDSDVKTISRKDPYTGIESSLTKIHTDDRWICLDAHHVASLNGNKIELATTNPKDLKDKGRERLIQRETAINRVKDLSR